MKDLKSIPMLEHSSWEPLSDRKVNRSFFNSRKLTDAQQWYQLIERELLRTVETLEEFITILLGQELIIYTDNKNLICKNFNTDRILRRRLILEEYDQNI